MTRARILVVEDDDGLREALVDTLLLGGYECREVNSGEKALLLLSRQRVDMVISDIQMGGMDGHMLLAAIRQQYPQTPVLLMTAYANIDGAVRAIRKGAIDYLAKPFSPEVLLNQVSRYVPAQKVEKRTLVYGDPNTAELLELATRVAKSDATVIVKGPSGTGKEVLARYIHDNSSRAEQPFVAINCAAIPDNMLEATLFGYEKGAFTGAVQGCPGKFEQAQGGTLLLDEITEMELGLQAKLLRVLQEKEVERLGSRKLISLNVRVIATTNRDLKKAVQDGRFREDLYYRLNVFPLRWRPLWERPGDILPLAKHLLALHASSQGLATPHLTKSACSVLLEHRWTGNVRELENVMQRALILSTDGLINRAQLFLETLDERDEPPIEHARLIHVERLGNELKHQEHQIILDTLQDCNGCRKEVADRLGISPRTLRYKLAQMREAGIDIPH
ncbi:sigma-54-dependent transcriptional regulator [Aeromonas cavernicola]|uniref:Sigma-54-dependent Fis family transcriptional regulator n=1 Tax=Aeromonas cavernicola TaxID=1006623 RepID=A0A2H9U5Q0_9GAMM|nr:sigma-54 dependent transcriptional regulator [Aeromonas cavernicola]PJG59360.1 sigma-54-dependent Fis family transcriptional regulator [Aeromonas cavernicola]